MAALSTPGFTKSGGKSTSAVKLDETVFGVLPENHELLKLAYTAYLANGRDNLAVTKTRGLVRGGGKKPWKQKGTGRARFGSSRNPIWRGGGIVFGPTGEENFSKKMPTTMKRQALRQALSLAVQEKRLSVIEAIESKDGTVKPMAALLSKINASGSILLVTEAKNDLLVRATRNLAGIKVVHAHYLNVYDLLNADCVVISQKGLEMVNTWLGGNK